jgi:Ca-activated chloride channel homolog
VKRAITAAILIAAVTTLRAQQPPPPAPPPPAAGDDSRERFRFKSGVELINVTATVSDENGRFVPGLRQEDFVIHEDNEPQEVAYFSADRVPVSLGVVLDASGSMAGEKMDDAKAALDRFVYELLDERDELFLYRFSDHPVLMQDWTSDRLLLSRAMSRITPNGGTAMYDAILQAIPRAATGQRPKKALLLISDGNDTSSYGSLRDVRNTLRESELLMYAIGIDGESTTSRPPPMRPRTPFPIPFPPGGGRRPGGRFPLRPQQQYGGGLLGLGLGQFGGSQGGGRQFPRNMGGDEGVNVVALRDMTDDSGGRTEIVRSARDLTPATASIADELSKQYSLGYASTLKRDGRWHSIKVEVRNHAYRVRARRGYVAS